MLPCLSLALLALAACGDDDGEATSPPAPGADASSVAPRVSPEPTLSPEPEVPRDLLAAWCDVKLGDTKADVIQHLGEPNGSKADAFKVAGIDSLEWNSGVTILLASFEAGKATNLQAYDNAVGPRGSSRIECESFRNSN